MHVTVRAAILRRVRNTRNHRDVLAHLWHGFPRLAVLAKKVRGVSVLRHLQGNGSPRKINVARGLNIANDQLAGGQTENTVDGAHRVGNRAVHNALHVLRDRLDTVAG